MPILTPEERIGQLVAGRYRLESLLASGGMGVLFRARDLVSDEPVAVKMLKHTHGLEPDSVARFEREKRIAIQLAHANVARTLDAWTDDSGVPFIVLELLEGHTLALELQQRGVLSLPEALAVVLPIVRALQAAHALGIVHRDLKPSNIFLRRGVVDGIAPALRGGAPDGTVTPTLLDFGIAKTPRDPFDTRTGMLVGTPGYIAPELAQFGECSPATDVWGIGAVLHTCLAGYAPHGEASSTELLARLIREPVPPLPTPGLGMRARATIDRALALDPQRRYATMQALERALLALSEGDDDATVEAPCERMVREPAQAVLAPTPAALPSEAAPASDPTPLPVASGRMPGSARARLRRVALLTLVAAGLVASRAADVVGMDGPPPRARPLQTALLPVAAMAPGLVLEAPAGTHLTGSAVGATDVVLTLAPADVPLALHAAPEPARVRRAAVLPAARGVAVRARGGVRRDAERPRAPNAASAGGLVAPAGATRGAIAPRETTPGLPVATEW